MQGLDSRNFPKASYESHLILEHKSIDSLVANLRAEAAALTKAQCSSWYVSLSLSSGMQRYLSATSNAGCLLGAHGGSADVSHHLHLYGSLCYCSLADISGTDL